MDLSQLSRSELYQAQKRIATDANIPHLRYVGTRTTDFIRFIREHDPIYLEVKEVEHNIIYKFNDLKQVIEMVENDIKEKKHDVMFSFRINYEDGEQANSMEIMTPYNFRNHLEAVLQAYDRGRGINPTEIIIRPYRFNANATPGALDARFLSEDRLNRPLNCVLEAIGKQGRISLKKLEKIDNGEARNDWLYLESLFKKQLIILDPMGNIWRTSKDIDLTKSRRSIIIIQDNGRNHAISITDTQKRKEVFEQLRNIEQFTIDNAQGMNRYYYLKEDVNKASSAQQDRLINLNKPSRHVSNNCWITQKKMDSLLLSLADKHGVIVIESKARVVGIIDGKTSYKMKSRFNNASFIHYDTPNWSLSGMTKRDFKNHLLTLDKDYSAQIPNETVYNMISQSQKPLTIINRTITKTDDNYEIVQIDLNKAYEKTALYDTETPLKETSYPTAPRSIITINKPLNRELLDTFIYPGFVVLDIDQTRIIEADNMPVLVNNSKNNLVIKGSVIVNIPTVTALFEAKAVVFVRQYFYNVVSFKKNPFSMLFKVYSDLYNESSNIDDEAKRATDMKACKNLPRYLIGSLNQKLNNSKTITAYENEAFDRILSNVSRTNMKCRIDTKTIDGKEVRFIRIQDKKNAHITQFNACHLSKTVIDNCKLNVYNKAVSLGIKYSDIIAINTDSITFIAKKGTIKANKYWKIEAIGNECNIIHNGCKQILDGKTRVFERHAGFLAPIPIDEQRELAQKATIDNRPRDIDYTYVEPVNEYTYNNNADTLKPTENQLLLTISGPAGTGKTEAIKHLLGESKYPPATEIKGINFLVGNSLKMAVTHRARQNINGEYTLSGFRANKNIKLDNVDNVIIDEYSLMTTDDLHDLDNRIRNIKRVNRPFGGMNVILSGDLKQLVAPESTPNNIISKSKLWPLFRHIELKKNFRQSNEQLKNVLLKTRNAYDNGATPCANKPVSPDIFNSEELDFLKSKIRTEVPEGYTSIVYTNKQANAINAKIKLVVGLPVRARFNDKKHGIYNGNIYKIESITGTVYTINKTKYPKTVFDVIDQYPKFQPLTASTNHTNQGQGIDRLHIDFTGMGVCASYVALSRATNVDNLILTNLKLKQRIEIIEDSDDDNEDEIGTMLDM